MEQVEVVVQQSGVGNLHQSGKVLLGARNDPIQLGGVREQVEVGQLEEVVAEKKGERYALELPHGGKEGAKDRASPRPPQLGWKPLPRESPRACGRSGIAAWGP